MYLFISFNAKLIISYGNTNSCPCKLIQPEKSINFVLYCLVRLPIRDLIQSMGIRTNGPSEQGAFRPMGLWTRGQSQISVALFNLISYFNTSCESIAEFLKIFKGKLIICIFCCYRAPLWRNFIFIFAEVRRTKPRYSVDEVIDLVTRNTPISDTDSEDEHEDWLPAPRGVSPSSDSTWCGSQSPGRRTARTVRSSTPFRKCPSPPFAASPTLDAMTYASQSPRPHKDESQLLQLWLSPSEPSDDSDGQNKALVKFFILRMTNISGHLAAVKH